MARVAAAACSADTGPARLGQGDGDLEIGEPLGGDGGLGLRESVAGQAPGIEPAVDMGPQAVGGVEA